MSKQEGDALRLPPTVQEPDTDGRRGEPRHGPGPLVTGRFIMRRVLLILALCVGAFIAAPTASAQTAAATLTGEQLVSSSTLDSQCVTFSLPGGNQTVCSSSVVGTQQTYRARCNDDGTGTITYSVTGAAVGPYPGTFQETGTVELGFVAGQSIPVPQRFEATFHIDSPIAQVDGRKYLVGAPSIGSHGYCGLPFHPLLAIFLINRPSYEATINLTVGGTFRDEGVAGVFGEGYAGAQIVPGIETDLQRNVHLFETFASSLPSAEPLGPAVVVLTPPADINTVGTSHSVTATATTSGGTPAANFTVYFTVAGSVAMTGQCTTNAQGQCNFTYQGPQLPGADLITGCADSNRDGDVDPGEPCGEATKVWVLPAAAPGQVTGGGWIRGVAQRVSFGFVANSDAKGTKGECNVIDHALELHIDCVTVDSLVVTGTHATFFGQATVNDTPTNYRIDVDDLGEPGHSDTFKIQTGSGYTAAGTLQGGNIQIHKQK